MWDLKNTLNKFQRAGILPEILFDCKATTFNVIYKILKKIEIHLDIKNKNNQKHY